MKRKPGRAHHRKGMIPGTLEHTEDFKMILAKMYMFDGMTIKQVAEIMGVSKSLVQSSAAKYGRTIIGGDK